MERRIVSLLTRPLQAFEYFAEPEGRCATDCPICEKCGLACSFPFVNDVPSSQAGDPARFEKALRRFDEENARDPNREFADGKEQPRELLYAVRLTDWIKKLQPDPSEALLLAARCQHLCRWRIPRHTHEMNRAGYLRWRNELKQFHARKSGEIMREVGYPEDMVRKVQDLNLKKNLSTDPDCRTLEDALCLVFLEHQFDGLAARATDETMINALRKTWNKMSPAARRRALQLDYTPRARQLLERAQTS